MFETLLKFETLILGSVHPEMVDFGFRQGPSEFSTAGIARYFED
jgi:hypothetical protein